LLALRLSRQIPARSIWLIGDAIAVELAYPAVNAALARNGSQPLVIFVPASSLSAVQRRLPYETVVPRQKIATLRRLIGHKAPRLIIYLGDVSKVIEPEIAVLAIPDAHRLAAADVLAALPAPGNHSSPRRPARLGWAQRLVTLGIGPPITTLTELSTRLGTPSTILCVGNGPSSEDPRLLDFPAPCLFRVNWIWRERGILVMPQLVFTADPDLPDRCHRPIIGFPTRRQGFAILERHILRLRPPSSGYFFCDDIEPTADEIGKDMLPTNGALMVTMAAALQPERIVIAGIDLYQHPSGRYPGAGGEAVDGYARPHSRDCDVGLIRRALASFSGEVIVFSDALNRALGEDHSITDQPPERRKPNR